MTPGIVCTPTKISRQAMDNRIRWRDSLRTTAFGQCRSGFQKWNYALGQNDYCALALCIKELGLGNCDGDYVTTATNALDLPVNAWRIFVELNDNAELSFSQIADHIDEHFIKGVEVEE